jgi:hypothetical protein
MKAPALNYPYVSVSTQPGELAAVVAGRLAEQLRESGAGLFDVLRTNDTTTLILGDGPVGVNGPCSSWILGGTDSGFNIPAPPLAVSASYDAVTDSVAMHWINPPKGYDSIVIVYYSVPLAVLPGNATHYVHQRRDGSIDAGFSSTDIPVLVMGYKDGVPSNGAGVRLRRHVEQESLMNVPFTAGIAPGFEPWVQSKSADAVKFRQGNLPEMKPGAKVDRLQGKGFQQIISGGGATPP